MKLSGHPLIRPRQALSLLMALVMASTMFCIPAFPNEQEEGKQTGYIRLVLTSVLPVVTSDNDLYSLAEARFGIFDDYDCNNRIGELTTDETGNAISDPLRAGRYFIQQEEAPLGFLLSSDRFQSDVHVGRTESLQIANTPEYSAPELIIREFNAETGQSQSIAGARLCNATYTVNFYASYDADSALNGPTRNWTFISDDNGEVRLSQQYLLGGAPLYQDATGKPVMPLGKYSVSIDNMPLGFERAQQTSTGLVTVENRTSDDKLCAFPIFDIALQPIRGDVSFRKTDAYGNTLSGIPFLIISDSGEASDAREAHVVITNENGDCSSRSDFIAHDMNTNDNDDSIITVIDSVYKLDESKLRSDAGIWFSKDHAGATSQANNAYGALPYGSYILQELPCSKNVGMNLVTRRFTIYNNDKTFSLGTIVNTAPGITGNAYETKSHANLIRPTKSISVTNEISYSNLIVGKNYKLVAYAEVSSTGEKVKGPDGSPAISYCEFTPSDSHGITLLELKLDTSNLAGERISLLSELTSDDGMSVPQKNDETVLQDLTVEPIVTFNAADSLDADKYCLGSNAIIHERMDYEGLLPGKLYKLVCTLYDKATGNTVRDAQGNVISVASEFRPETNTGHADLMIPFDADRVAGHDVVVFDTLVDESDAIIADHQDMENANQTIKTVKLTSSAFDKSDGDKMFDASATGVTICDTVNYANLVPGKQYTMRGVLMDKETGSVALQDGAPIIGSASFVPTEISGSVDVEYAFDASRQSSQVLVAFETLEHDGNIIAQHADLDDAAQTVTSEEVNGSENLFEAQGAFGKSGGAQARTGDFLVRVFLAIVALSGCILLCTACVLRHRRKTLETIARIGDMQD